MQRNNKVDKVYAVMGGFHLPADGGIYERPNNTGYLEISVSPMNEPVHRQAQKAI
jgi:hypothetical protein